MADPVIVAPPPTVQQGEAITPLPPTQENLDFSKNVQDIFDRVAPDKYVPKTPPKSAEQPLTQPKQQPSEIPPPPVTPPAQEPQTTPKTEPKEPQEHKLPSFIEEVLKVQPGQAQPKTEEEWPEELPEFKTTEEAKARYKNWRAKYGELKENLKIAQNRPALDEQTRSRIEFLEGQNKQMDALLKRDYLEGHAEFQNNIIRPMSAAWYEAARTLKEVGGDPQALAKAVTLQGKAQFEALDEILSDVPESAKTEINNALASYRRYDEARLTALRNAPQAAEALRRKDMERQYQIINMQKEGMSNLFEEAVRKLRDEARVEVLLKSSDPEAKWWNDQADSLVSQSRALYLDNTDMGRMAMACVLAPMADTYRKLWLTERAKNQKMDTTMKERFGSEPTLSESGGNAQGPSSYQEDMKKPFSEIFLRELHKQAGR